VVLKAYIAAVAALAVLASVVAGRTVPATHHIAAHDALLLAVLVLLAERIQVRDHHAGEHIGALNLMEGVLAPLVLFTSGTAAVLICTAALLVADLQQRQQRQAPLKVVFNVSQWVLATAAGSLTLHELVQARHASLLLALPLTMLLMSAVNHAAITVVLALATGSAGRDLTGGPAFRHGFLARLVSSAAAATTGMCLVALYRWNSWLVALGVLFLVGLARAGQANADVHTDRRRLAALQQATHCLVSSVDLTDALPSFLNAVRDGFEVRRAEVVLRGPGGIRTFSAAATGFAAGEADPALSQLLRSGGAITVDRGRGEDQLLAAVRALGHSRALAVPLQAATGTLGALVLYDRLGVEGFAAGERQVAEALGSELVGFLQRVELMRAFDDERRKLTGIVESTSDGILTIDADGVITSWNRGIAEITGFRPDEMVGTRHIGLLRPRDSSGRDVMIERWARSAADPVLPTELQVVGASGRTVWLSCSHSRIAGSSGGADVLVIVARNVTQARELERLKDDFIAVVSHELRTPLVPIKGWAQTLLHRGTRLTDDQRRTAVQSILAQAQKLESLILNILEASRIEAGRHNAEAVADLGAIALHVVQDTLAARPERLIRLRPAGVPTEVCGSPVWIERAVSNLVANAVKYSPDDEPIDVTIDVYPGELVLAVTDRGPGIAPAAHERIFERFERLEGASTQTGTGLGLYITRRLARAMNGDVTVSSVPGAGSTFLLRLPLASSLRLPRQRAALDAEAAAPVARLG
jgi:PAS domain S-box-containing protein